MPAFKSQKKKKDEKRLSCFEDKRGMNIKATSNECTAETPRFETKKKKERENNTQNNSNSQKQQQQNAGHISFTSLCHRRNEKEIGRSGDNRVFTASAILSEKKKMVKGFVAHARPPPTTTKKKRKQSV